MLQVLCALNYTRSKSNECDLAFGIEDMVEEESEIENDESKLWVDGIDRGGLFKVNDCTFLTIESVVRKYFPSQEDKGAGTRLKCMT